MKEKLYSLPWVAKWAIRQSLGTKRGNALIEYIETSPEVAVLIGVITRK